MTLSLQRLCIFTTSWRYINSIIIIIIVVHQHLFTVQESWLHCGRDVEWQTSVAQARRSVGHLLYRQKNKPTYELPDDVSSASKAFIERCFKHDLSSRPSADDLLRDDPFICDASTLRDNVRL